MHRTMPCIAWCVGELDRRPRGVQHCVYNVITIHGNYLSPPFRVGYDDPDILSH